MIAGFDFSRAAAKSLKKLRQTNLEDSIAIRRRIKALLEDPRPPQSLRISGYNAEIRRIRVGAYRVIYAVDGDTLHIGVVARRNKAYQELAALFRSGKWPPAAE